MSNFDYSFGAHLLADGETRFRLWAPSAKAASVLIGDAAYPLQSLADGWYEAHIHCGPGTRYCFETVSGDDSVLRFADPASRAQAGDVRGASIVADPHSYRWLNAQWRGRPWHETVLYELHVGAFGGFEGVMQKLPQLAALGITAIELMPIAEFPGRHNWGYDGVLPYAPDSSYGTPDQLKTLVDTAHGLGLMVFLDVVYNHFGPDGNYLGAYAQAFFRDDIHTPWGQAIDFRQPQVSDFFIENAVYWLREFRFDGLRFDAVHQIVEQEWLQTLGTRIRATIGAENSSRHVHLVLEHDGNAAHLLGNTAQAPFDAQWNDDGHHALHVLLTGERDHYYRNYSEDTAQKLARCLAEGFVYQGEPIPSSGEPRGEPSADLPPSAFVLFLQNHDQIGNRAFGERLRTLARPSALRAATALLLLSPQIPLLFMGDEYGAEQPFLYFTDHTPDLAAAVRDGRRQEFAGFAAFTDPKKREQIPDPNALSTFEQSIPAEGTDAAAWLDWTRKLLQLRRARLAP
ncbi:MAG TPA: malto-oligosyltrehalose trehalohydrolase, partial [Oxalicibacterium sp.]|nr:malto-oligosyltrehalose trehalohydrolase [Oxalicibacterium sp.]